MSKARPSPGGYMGKILRVDLLKQKAYSQEIAWEILLLYLGGVGLGSKILCNSPYPHIRSL